MDNQPENTTPATETVAIPTYVTYTDYTTPRLSCGQPLKKTVPGTGANAKPPCPEQNYHSIPLSYNFSPDEGKRVLGDFLLEGPEISSPAGIVIKQGQNGREEQSIMVRFDLNNPDHVRFIETLEQIYMACAHIVGQFKGQVRLPHFNPAQPQALMRELVYYARDPMTFELIEGRAPSMFVKLFSRGKPPMVERTLFTDLTGKPQDWAVLQGVEMKIIPLFHIKNIYCGSKASVQMEMVSAVITDIRGRNTETAQLSTISRILQSRPELQDKVAAQLARLAMDRQGSLVAADGSAVPATPAAGSATDTTPTFAGITPMGRQPAAETTEEPKLPSPSAATLPPIASFAAMAPPRAPLPPAAVPGVSHFS